MKRTFILTFILSALIIVSCSSKQAGNETETATEVVSENGQTAIKDYGKKQAKITVIDFSATWCGPCRRLKPIFEEIEKEYSKDVNFKTIDVDENQQMAIQYQVEAVPTIVFLNKEGKEVNRLVGLQTKEAIVSIIKELK